MLKVFLQEDSGFLRDFTLNDGLVLVKDKFRDYACYFAHCFIMLFLLMQHYIHEDVWHELYSHEFFLHEIFFVDEARAWRKNSIWDSVLKYLG